MRLPGCLIVAREDGWMIAAGENTQDLSADSTDDQIAQAAAELCRGQGLREARCVIALPSKSCFFAVVNLDDHAGTRDHNAMLYLLEDQLPIDAESIVADFGPALQQPDGGSQWAVSAVAISWRRWKTIVDAVESRGIHVMSLIPTAVLIARGVDADTSTSVSELLIVSPEGCDLVTWQADGLRSWKHLQLQTEALLRHQRLHPGTRLWIAGEAESETLSNAGFDGALIARDPHAYLIAGAEIALANRWGRWCDLRRDSLAPSDPLRPIAGPLNLVALAATVCCAVLIFGSWYRVRRIEQRIDQISEKQQAAFREAFPETRVPVMLMRHVRGQHTKILGSRGRSSEVDAPTAATDVVRRVIAGLEDNVRFRIVEIDVTDGECKLTVRVRESVDIGKLASGLENAGFDVLPPATQQIDPSRDEPILTYESTLTATWPGELADNGSADES
ncbi:type II secretion system protein GspL [Stieleria varia]|uniref:GspL periplasmic domain protein n=1 Tax=Stieleria varia TaxID=2528005 RepID=A0A5C6AJM6_9BACT|nr:type II secretion system protein GspL [Stieleria varia]TWT98403.1 hypothetical protein Pla52n_49160 [Stieleria varia]